MAPISTVKANYKLPVGTKVMAPKLLEIEFYGRVNHARAQFSTGVVDGPDGTIDALIQAAGILRHIGGLQCRAHILHRKLECIQALGIQQHPHHALRRSQRGNFPCAGDALQLRFDGMSHVSQFQAAAKLLFAPQCQRHHRNVVYAFSLDDGLGDCQRGWQPVGM